LGYAVIDPAKEGANMKTVFVLVVWFHLTTPADGPDRAAPSAMTTVGPFASQSDCDGAATAIKLAAGRDVPVRHLCVPVLGR